MEPFGKRFRIPLHVIKRSVLLWLIFSCICSMIFFFCADKNLDRSRSVNTENLLSSALAATTVTTIREFLKYPNQTRNQLNIDALNNTKKATNEILFFNRVPKVGSQTFMELLRRMSAKNQFNFGRDSVQRVEMVRLNYQEQFELARLVTQLPTPAVFIKHVCYTNFTRLGQPQPIYVNLVRDPIERVISWFYYIRAPWYFVERKKLFPELPFPDTNWLRKDFETCVLSGDEECIYHQGYTREGIGDHRRQTLFFCGHEPDCLPFNTQGALEKAKYAVESQYAVVGVLEDLNTTLTVLENYIPRFFRGANDEYYASKVHAINTNMFKPPVSEMVKDIVRKNFTREIEFYEFCRQRLHKQYAALNLV